MRKRKEAPNLDPWTYEGVPVLSLDDMPGDVYGFVYEITNKVSGKKYIGKKATHSYKTKISHKLNEATGRMNKVKDIIKTEADWRSYFGSSVEIKEAVKSEGKDNFDRQILRYCFSKKELTYYETKYQFERGVLESDDYYNSNILGKFYKKDLVSYVSTKQTKA